MKTRYANQRACLTRDQSEIRELMHPARDAALGAARQSLAEARVAPGASTLRHRHRTSEEIYHITGGHGLMEPGAQAFAIGPGDSLCSPPGTPHRLHNTGTETLACSLPCRHEDTELPDA